MLFIRSLFYFIGMVLTAIIVSILALFLFFLPLLKRYQVLSLWQRYCLWWLKITCNIHFNVCGREHIPNKPCVVVSNHQSSLDVLFLPLILPAHTGVLKKQLLYIPFFGWGLSLMHPIIIDRKKKLNAVKTVIITGANRLKKGLFVIIYPEGTRATKGKLAPYQTGGILLAEKANVPILPIAHNTAKVWRKGCFIKHPGTVNIHIGELITEIDHPKQIAKELHKWTEAELKKMND